MNRSMKSLLLAVASALCLSFQAFAADPVRVTFAHPYSTIPELTAGFAAAVDQFNKENPGIVVEIVDFPGDPLVADAGGVLPDVIHTGRSMSFTLFDSGATIDLEPYVARLPEWNPEEFLEAYIDSFRWNGHLYALPGSTAQLPILFWNPILFEEKGLDGNTPPMDLQESVVYAQRLTRIDEDGTVREAGFPAYYGVGAFNLIAYFGGSVYDFDNHQVTVNTNPAREAMEWLTTLYRVQGGLGHLGWGAFTGWTRFPWEEFAHGNVGMIQNNDYLWNFFSSINPEMTIANGRMKAGPAIVGHPDGGVIAHTDSTVVASTAQHPEAAVRFAVSLNFGPAARAFAEHWPTLVPSRTIANELLYTVGPDRQQVIQAQMETFHRLRPYPFFPEAGDLLNNLNAAFEQVVRGEATPSVLEDIEKRTQAMVNQRLARP